MRELTATSRALAILACLSGCVQALFAQFDTVIHVYQLGDVVVHAHEPGNRYEGFIQQVMQDTSFHHAFLNTRFYPHRLTGDLRVRDRKEKRRARWLRWAHLERRGAIAELITDSVLEEGNLRKADDDVGCHRMAQHGQPAISLRPRKACNCGSLFYKRTSCAFGFGDAAGQRFRVSPMACVIEGDGAIAVAGEGEREGLHQLLRARKSGWCMYIEG